MNYNLRLLDLKYYKSLLLIIFLSYLSLLPLFPEKNLVLQALVADLFLITTFLYNRRITFFLVVILFLLDIITSNLLGSSLIKFYLLRSFFHYAEKKSLDTKIVLLLGLLIMEIIPLVIKVFYKYSIVINLYSLVLSVIFLPILLKVYRK
jgi:hypothetical protein